MSCGINQNTLISRINAGWNIDRAINTPSNKYNKLKND